MEQAKSRQTEQSGAVAEGLPTQGPRAQLKRELAGLSYEDQVKAIKPPAPALSSPVQMYKPGSGEAGAEQESGGETSGAQPAVTEALDFAKGRIEELEQLQVSLLQTASTLITARVEAIGEGDDETAEALGTSHEAMTTSADSIGELIDGYEETVEFLAGLTYTGPDVGIRDLFDARMSILRARQMMLEINLGEASRLLNESIEATGRPSEDLLETLGELASELRAIDEQIRLMERVLDDLDQQGV